MNHTDGLNPATRPAASASPSTHVMIVEDDESLAAWMADYLSANGFVVSLANEGLAALDLIRIDQPDLIVLDLMLPGLSGFEICRRSREFYHRPILILTARDDDLDEIEGLSVGADDYLVKPVRPAVLLARIQALLRRDAGLASEQILGFGELRIDVESRTVHWQGRPVALSTHETDLLILLARHAGTTLTREQLVTEMRGIEYDGHDRSIDISISRLRRKLGDTDQPPRRIKTIRGQGYRLAPDAW